MHTSVITNGNSKTLSCIMLYHFSVCLQDSSSLLLQSQDQYRSQHAALHQLQQQMISWTPAQVTEDSDIPSANHTTLSCGYNKEQTLKS